MLPPQIGHRRPLADTGDGLASGPGYAIRRQFAVVLDLLIAVYAPVLALILATGGIDLGLVSLNDAAKPIVMLAVLIPLRLTLRERSRLLPVALVPLQRHLGVIRPWVISRVPNAVLDVGFALAVTQAMTFFIAFLADVLFAPYRPRAFAMPFARVRFAQVFAGWDSGWYFDIASRGYYFNLEGQSSIAFFPVYPMLMRAVAWPLGGTDRAVWIAGIVVSCVAFALALLVVHRFTQRLTGDRETARRAVLYMALFPFSFFFTRVYAESVFLLTSVLAISQAYDGRWKQAGVWGALATLARPNGILVALPLVVLALGGHPTARARTQRLAALLPVPLALAAYCAYVYTLSGDALGWLSAQAHWGYSLGHPPWEQLLKMVGRVVKYGFHDYFFVSPMAPFRLFHGAVALIFLAIIPAVFRQLGLALGAYVLVSLLVPLSGNALEGVGRYAAVLFPAFIVVGGVKSVRLHEGILVVSSLLLALFVCLFSAGRPLY